VTDPASWREEPVVDSPDEQNEGGTVDADGAVDDLKRKFRVALERKHAKRSTGSTADGEDRAKVPEAHGPAHTQRQFRRKSGG
jgi:hypothetical protein